MSALLMGLSLVVGAAIAALSFFVAKFGAGAFTDDATVLASIRSVAPLMGAAQLVSALVLVTEGVLIGDFTRALNLLRRLKALGVRIAMDDFGTGYSSLSYLQSFPFDKIKIDRSFISNLEATPQSAEIVRAVLSLAHALNIPVIAEGVETEAQRAFLAREACEEMQGYLVGRPDLMERLSRPGRCDGGAPPLRLKRDEMG